MAPKPTGLVPKYPMIQDTFEKTIRKFQMIQKGDSLLIAVSGGCDSCVLLQLLLELAPARKLKLSILHVNHGLRGKASDQDEAFVRSLAQKNKIPFYSTKTAVSKFAKTQKMSLEEAARTVRYEFFEHMAKLQHAQKIALAHTLDDQAETVLMRIINGTGLQGLQAIRPKRKLNSAYLIRPLIEIPRGEIRAFAKREKIKFREDKSNQSLKFTRNKIRLKLIPFIEKQFNPQVKKALARLPHLLDVDLSFLDETAELCYRRIAKRERSGKISFPKKSFLRLKPAIQYRLLGCSLHELGKAGLDYDHWNRFFGLLVTKHRFKYSFPKNLITVVSSEMLTIQHAKRLPVSFSHALKLGKSVYVPELDATLSCERLTRPISGNGFKKTDKNFEILDAAQLQFPLAVRTRKPGDRLQPLGQNQPVKLKRFLINRGIPVEQRDSLPLVISKDQIAWVGGVTLSDPFKITSKTKSFVRLVLEPGNSI